jgi:hypothetical protein
MRVRLPDGSVVNTQSAGLGEATIDVSAGLLCLLVAAGCAFGAVRARRMFGSWWSTMPGGTFPFGFPTWSRVPALLLFLAVGPICLLLALGVSLHICWVVGGAAPVIGAGSLIWTRWDRSHGGAPTSSLRA